MRFAFMGCIGSAFGISRSGSGISRSCFCSCCGTASKTVAKTGGQGDELAAIGISGGLASASVRLRSVGAVIRARFYNAVALFVGNGIFCHSGGGCARDRQGNCACNQCIQCLFVNHLS